MAIIKLSLAKFKSHLFNELKKRNHLMQKVEKVEKQDVYFFKSLNNEEKITLDAVFDNLEIEFKLAMHKETDLSDQEIQKHLTHMNVIKEGKEVILTNENEKTIHLAFILYKKDLTKGLSRKNENDKKFFQFHLDNMNSMEKKMNSNELKNEIKVGTEMIKEQEIHSIELINNVLSFRKKLVEASPKNKIKY